MGGKRKGAGRPKAAPTKNITFRVRITWIPEIKKLVKERMKELRNSDLSSNVIINHTCLGKQKLDLDTLKTVKFVFNLYSNLSSNTLGYFWLEERIKEIETENLKISNNGKLNIKVEGKIRKTA
jgi:hypothetical protein